MKWVHTVVLIDKGGVLSDADWGTIHESFTHAISLIDHPEGTGKLVLREKYKDAEDRWVRNGVVYLKNRFIGHMVNEEKWTSEVSPEIVLDEREPILLFPSKEVYQVPPADFGGFDFFTTAPDGLRVALEWETGNVSSSHRSMNKMAIALNTGAIDAGVLIVPSRAMYKNLTDRIGNFEELRGYLRFWQGFGIGVERGLLAISVVEHDSVTTEESFPMLPIGGDGNSRRGKGNKDSKAREPGLL